MVLNWVYMVKWLTIGTDPAGHRRSKMHYGMFI
ncbi:MAG: hypothetical protein QOK33_5607 [Mycobacterium sp.]|nr:hypothetical protein [Mycobacterium sp.]